MARSRRSMLAALAGLAGAGGCLRGSPDGPRRPTRPPELETTTAAPWTYTPVDSEPEKPEVVGQELFEGPEGNLTVAATLRNGADESVAGTLVAFVTVEGSETRHATPFTLGADETGTVNASVPVDFEAFMDRPNLRLSVSLEPDPSSPTTA